MRLFGSFQWKISGDKSPVCDLPKTWTKRSTHVNKRQFQSCPKSLGYPYVECGCGIDFWRTATEKVKDRVAAPGNRDFKIQRRGRQRERVKNNRFIKKNNNFARASRFFVHFFACFCTTTTWKYLISCFMENVNDRRRNYISLSELGYSHLKFSFRRVRLHLTK